METERLTLLTMDVIYWGTSVFSKIFGRDSKKCHFIIVLYDGFKKEIMNFIPEILRISLT